MHYTRLDGNAQQRLRNTAGRSEHHKTATEPCISAKEPYISAKEPYIYVKEPCRAIDNKMGFYRAGRSEPHTTAKEPCTSAKEP